MDSTLSGLPEVTITDPEDLLYLVTVAGDSRRVKAATLISGLPVASDVSKGLMSATDKGQLDVVIADVALLKAPLTSTIATATTIVVPAGIFSVLLTGTTTVTSVVGLVNYQTYTFMYPAGAGLTFMGVNMQAGDIYQFVQTP